jgi:hypothetical protein
MRFFVLSLVAFLSSLFGANVRGAILYEQLPGTNSRASYISSTLDENGELPGARAADNFRLSFPAVISDIHWWGVDVEGGTDFSFTFYDDNAGVPGNVLHTTGGSLTTTPDSPGGFPVTFYSSDLDAPFETASNTTYWVSVFDAAPDAVWAWLEANDFGDFSWQGSEPPPPWQFDRPDLSFQLTGTAIPEPSTIAIWSLLGLAGLGYGWRKRRKAA